MKQREKKVKPRDWLGPGGGHLYSQIDHLFRVIFGKVSSCATHDPMLDLVQKCYHQHICGQYCQLPNSPFILSSIFSNRTLIFIWVHSSLAKRLYFPDSLATRHGHVIMSWPMRSVLQDFQENSCKRKKRDLHFLLSMPPTCNGWSPRSYLEP